LLLLDVQVPLLIVQLNTYVPFTRPDTVAMGSFTSEKVGVLGPLTFAQVPTPTIGVFPSITVDVVPHILLLEPALDVVGFAQIVICVVSEDVHGPFATVHCNLYTPGIMPDMVEEAD
jgi:hypothetical protein